MVFKNANGQNKYARVTITFFSSTYMWSHKVWEPWFKSPNLWNIIYSLAKWAKTHPGSPAALLFSFQGLMFFIDKSAMCPVWYKRPEHWVDSHASVGEMSHRMEGWWNRSKLLLPYFFLISISFSASSSTHEWQTGNFAVPFQNQYDKVSAKAARGRLVYPGKPTWVLLWNKEGQVGVNVGVGEESQEGGRGVVLSVPRSEWTQSVFMRVVLSTRCEELGRDTETTPHQRNHESLVMLKLSRWFSYRAKRTNSLSSEGGIFEKNNQAVTPLC